MRLFSTVLCLLSLVIATWPVGVFATNNSILFQAPKLEEAAAYDLDMTGNITISPPDGPVVTNTVTFSAALSVSWGSSGNRRTGQVSLISPTLKVNDNTYLSDWGNTNLSLTFNEYGQLLKAETPAPLSELGIDLTLVLLGLVIPNQASSCAIGDRWSVKAVIGDAAISSYNLEGDYNLRSIEDWSQSKLGRIEALLQLVPANKFLMRRPKASLVAYVDPASGRMERSAVSLESFINLPSLKQNDFEEPTAKIYMTTRLTYLGALDIDTLHKAKTVPPEAKPTTPVTQKESVPVSVVNQPISDPSTEPAANDVASPSASPGINNSTLAALTMTYTDPAGRFSLAFPADWRGGNMALSIDTTRFSGPRAGQHLDITISKADNISLEETALFALNAIEKQSTSFASLGATYDFTLDGTTAIATQYEYLTNNNERIREVAIFARHHGYNYIYQYSDTPQRKDIVDIAHNIASSFRFGATPAGSLPLRELENTGFYQYLDPNGRYVIDVPYLWPLFDITGNATTFAELGRKGFLSVYVQENATVGAAEEALRTMLASEPGAGSINMQPVTIGGLAGNCLTYNWQAANLNWTRQAFATTYYGLLFVVVTDYTVESADEHSGVLTRLLNSFRPGPALPSVWQSIPQSPGPALDNTTSFSTSFASPLPVTLSAGGNQLTPGTIHLDSPLDDRRLIIVGRLGETKDGKTTWLPGIILRLTAGASIYATVTDANGYFAFCNVAPFSRGPYQLTSAEGVMLGYLSAVTANIPNFNINAGSSRAISLGSVLFSIDKSGNATIQKESDASAILQHFIIQYPNTGWSAILKSALSTP